MVQNISQEDPLGIPGYGHLAELLSGSRAEARLLGLEPDSPAYLKWVKDTMLFIFLPVLEKALTRSPG
jgi:hypothetical protein